MAKVVEETIKIKLSKLVGNKDSFQVSELVNEDVVQTLEDAAKELIQDPSVIVEAEAGPETKHAQQTKEKGSNNETGS